MDFRMFAEFLWLIYVFTQSWGLVEYNDVAVIFQKCHFYLKPAALDH